MPRKKSANYNYIPKSSRGGAASSRSKKQKLKRSPVFRDSRLSDSRYTQRSTIEKLNRLTGKRWDKAYDPTVGETRAGGQTNALLRDWDKPTIYLNPPFSQSSKFVSKLVGDMTRFPQVTNAMAVLPWYQVEDVATRVSKKPQWHHRLEPAMAALNKRELHLGNQPFYDPHHKKMTDVRVYGIHLTKDREEDRIGYVDRPRRNMEALRNFQEHIEDTII